MKFTITLFVTTGTTEFFWNAELEGVIIVIVVCKKYYIETLIKELGINATNISPNSTYIPSTDSFDEILKSHCKFIESVGLEMSEEDKNLPYLYWTPKLHKVPFKHRFIAGSSKCTTKDLSCLLTKC